ncbi:hypothetical protein [Kitasatospora cineracea]|uniref:hypothetical protein n=1 Tax=Kitasatospora cineracea TaxID=88074 RepID=UPI0037A37E8B
MTARDFREAASNLGDAKLIAILEKSGWRKFGGQENLYSRWRPEGTEGAYDSRGILVPQNQRMEDYTDLLVQAVTKAWTIGDARLKSLIERAENSQILGDLMRFHKEASTRKGTIQWLAGEDLYSAARKSMTVAAKTRRSKLAYYGNSNSYLARSFLESVLMGQTEVGSYVVTAYSKPQEIYSEVKPRPGGSLPLTGTHSGREITRNLVDVLNTVREVVDHFADTGSTSGFTDSVSKGFCYEITHAVRDLVRDSDGGQVRVELQASEDLFDEVPAEAYSLSFTPADYPILEKAGNILAATVRPELVTALGTVTLLDRPKPGSPGVVRLEVLSGTSAKKLRVRLKVEDYDMATDAHRLNMAIRVSGRQELEGKYYWLYDPEIIELVPIEVAEHRGVGTGEQDPIF